MKTEQNFDVAIIDLDSHIYSIAWVTTDISYARKVLMQNVEKVVQQLEVPEALVFIKGDSNFRYLVDPEYKANRRRIMDPEVQYRIDQLYEYAKEEFTQAHYGEADDYCCIYAHQYMAEGKIPVVVHIDKDLNMIPGWHFNPKKEKNGLYFTSAQDSFVFMAKQLLTGDAADNIPGIRGMGPVGASKGLQNKRLDQFSDRIRELWQQASVKKDGYPDWEDRMYKSFNCLLLRETMEEMRELTREEMDKKLSWSLTRERYMAGITDNMGMISNSFSDVTNEEMFQGPSIFSAESKCKQDTGNATTNSQQMTTSDSSTE